MGGLTQIRAFAVALAASLFLFSACGGRTADFPDPGGSGSDAQPGTDTGSTPDTDAGSPPDVATGCPLPSDVNSGASCAQPGLDCPSRGFAPDCNGQPTLPVTCNCGLGVWNCTHVIPPCPPPLPPCPSQATIQAGASCAVASDLFCQSPGPIYELA